MQQQGKIGQKCKTSIIWNVCHKWRLIKGNMASCSISQPSQNLSKMYSFSLIPFPICYSDKVLSQKTRVSQLKKGRKERKEREKTFSPVEPKSSLPGIEYQLPHPGTVSVAQWLEKTITVHWKELTVIIDVDCALHKDENSLVVWC